MEPNRKEQKTKEQGSKISFKRRIALSLFLLSLFLVPVSADCQTWGELFNQTETQKKYLLQQIAGLQVYIGYAKKGYDIVGSGINTIKDIKNGEFGLHSAFFNSLKAVNPAIRNNSKVAEIIFLQLSISKSFNGIKNDASLSAGNRDYIRSVRAKVLEECATDLEELLLVITSGKIEMKDDERIKRLDLVYSEMKDKSAFTQSFCNNINLLIRQKENEHISINQIQKLYETY